MELKHRARVKDVGQLSEKVVIGKRLDTEQPLHLNVKRLTHLLFTASSGYGKSTGLRGIMERTFEILPHLTLDREGEFWTLREEFDYALIGPNGDEPLNLGAARPLPEKMLEAGFSVIVDFSQSGTVTETDERGKHKLMRARHAYVRDVYSSLGEIPRAKWADLLIFHDEAHFDVPETNKQDERPVCYGPIVEGASVFRKRGFHMLLATQRLSKLAKDAAAECDNKLVGHQNLADDRDRALKELGVYSNKKEWLPVLAKLKPGEFIAVGPAFGLEEPTLVRLDLPKTKEPPKGKNVFKAPAPRAKVLKILEALKQLPHEAAKKAQTETELRGEIKTLKTENEQLRRSQSRPVVETKVQTKVEVKEVKVPILKDGQLARIEALQKKAEEAGKAFVERMNAELERVQKTNEAIAAAVAELGVIYNGFAKGTQEAAQARAAVTRQPVTAAAPVPNTPPRVAMPSQAPQNGTAAKSAAPVGPDGVPLTTPEQRILNAMAWCESIGVKEPEQAAVAFLADYKVGGGAFNNPRGALRRKGLLEYRGEKLALTEEGRKLARRPEASLTVEELHRHVLGVLPTPEQRVLMPLLRKYPEPMSNEDLAREAGYELGGGAYNNPRGRLRTLGLIEYLPGDLVKAKSLLFLGKAKEVTA